jgi:S-adenosyl methyltransferase
MHVIFLTRAVRYLAVDAGIRQFLDVGTGLPTVDNTHQVAQRAAPEAKIVYVDNDPMVLVHARALLTSTPEGVCEYIDADLRDPDTIVRAPPGHRVPAVCLPPHRCGGAWKGRTGVPDQDDPP